MTVPTQPGLRALRPYSPGKPAAAEVLRLHCNENPLGPSPKVVAALAAALDGLNFYPDPEAHALRAAIAARLGVRAEMVKVGNGADGIIREICGAFVGDGDEVIVASATFPNYDIGAVLMRGRTVPVPLRDFGLDLDGMLAAITPRTRIIFVCNPNNPTGMIVTAAQLAAFMARVPDDILVVLDEAYYEFVDAPDFPDGLAYVAAGRDNVIVLRTFSKVYGVAGIRIGYCIGVPEVLGPVWTSSDTFPVNNLAQEAGRAALEDVAFLERTRQVTGEGKRFLCGEFDRLGLRHLPSQTNFVAVRVGPAAAEVHRALTGQGILVRGCAGYGLPEWLRVTVGLPEQNARFVAALAAALGAGK